MLEGAAADDSPDETAGDFPGACVREGNAIVDIGIRLVCAPLPSCIVGLVISPCVAVGDASGGLSEEPVGLGGAMATDEAI